MKAVSIIVCCAISTAWLSSAETKPGIPPELRAAAEQGDAKAQYQLGRRIESAGHGPFGVAERDAEAVPWFRKAADQGYAPAQVTLANFYNSGRGGKKDWAESARLYRLAAEQGYAPGQMTLGSLYMSGKRGLKQDPVEAVKWYRKAAEQGDRGGQTELGIAYANGTGVPVDLVQAYYWMKRARVDLLTINDKDLREVKARKRRDLEQFHNVTEKMTAAQKEEAEKLLSASSRNEPVANEKYPGWNPLIGR